MERTSPVLDVLLPKTKQHLLSVILLRPERSWYLNELARRLHVSPSSLQRELAQFVEAGIVTRRQDGNRVYFQADRGCPVFRELFGMLTKTVGLADAVRAALTPLRSKIDLAFVYGSIASSEERSSSDVDLMIIGQANLADLAIVVKPLEEELGRSVNPSVYTNHEFLKRLRAKNHFLSSVLKTELLFIFGRADDLARLVDGAAGKGPSDQPMGDPRSPRRG
jgi:predicted nucleotidyltransferase